MFLYVCVYKYHLLAHEFLQANIDLRISLHLIFFCFVFRMFREEFPDVALSQCLYLSYLLPFVLLSCCRCF